MMIAIAAFVVMSLAIVAGFVTAAYLPSYLAGRRLEQRLRDASASAFGSGDDADATVVKKEAEGPLPGLDRLLARLPIGAWLWRLIQQAGATITPGGVLTWGILLAVAAAFAASAFIRIPFAPAMAAFVGGMMPVLWLMNKRSRRLKRFEEQFPEALDLLSRAIRAGHAFQTAIGMVADELPPPVGPEFKKTFDQQNFGLPLRDALNELAVRVNTLDVKFFVTAVMIQRDTGGNLAEILDGLAHVVRERFKIRRQVRVHTAHGRFTGYVLLALPAALAVVLSYENPDTMQVLFRERVGQMMVLGAIVLQTIGFFWIRKVIKIEV